MVETITFPSATHGLAIPLLFTGQAQKEFVLNQAFATIDAVLVGGIEAVEAVAPTDAADGTCFVVGSDATGEWHLHDHDIAVRIGGGWHFISPQKGMEVYDRSEGGKLVFKSEWKRAAAIDAPTGGANVDSEARQVLTQLLEALGDLGILPTTDS